ncbi:MAG: ethanolamine ammonia-lyase subunit EutC [Pseudomonadota bacterium]
MSAPDPWADLRRHTAARIALGRAGGSLPTDALLDFQLAHARARDAVQHAVDFAGVAAEITRATDLNTLKLDSAAADRQSYLRRPDLGRRLSTASKAHLVEQTQDLTESRIDLALVVGDGLSGFAAERNVPPLLEALAPLLRDRGWRLAPVVLVEHARVAIQDEIGELLNARLSVILIGERPGLGTADSLAAYFTWAPRIGRSDAERNCISNIRAEGLPPADAARRLDRLLGAAFERQLSGVSLKDDSPLEQLGGSVDTRNQGLLE